MNRPGVLKTSLLLFAAAVMSAAAQAGADSIKLTNGLTYDPVTITDVADGFIRFRMSGGAVVQKPVGEVAVVTIPSDRDFTRGEGLLRQGKYAQAESAYAAARRSAVKQWKKALIDYRLLASAEAAGRIDKAAERWLKIVDAADASPASLAMRPKKLAPARSSANDRAIALLKAKAKDVDSKAHLKAIRILLVDLYERQGRLAEARAVAAQLAGHSTTSPTTRPNDRQPVTEIPPAGSAGAQLRLARLSLKGGRYGDVVRQLQPNLKRFGAAELPSALLMLGRARLALAARESKKAAGRKLLLAAGLDLMCVAVFFPSSAEAPQALLLAGVVNERLGNAEAAKAAYSTVVSRFGKSPPAKEAQKALERMKKGRSG